MSSSNLQERLMAARERVNKYERQNDLPLTGTKDKDISIDTSVLDGVNAKDGDYIASVSPTSSQASPTFSDVDDEALFPLPDSTTAEKWLAEAPKSYEMSEKLYSEIQSAVEAVEDRLAENLDQEISSLASPSLSQNSSAKSENDKPLLIIEVNNVGEGGQATIEVRTGDQPIELAKKFVNEHGLSQETIPTLQAHIEHQMDVMLNENDLSEEPASPTTSARVQALDRESYYNNMMQSVKENKASIAKSTKNIKRTKSKPKNTTKSSNSTSVFHRLYSTAAARELKLKQAAKKKQMEEEQEVDRTRVQIGTISRKLASSRNTSEFSHAGERLYEQGRAGMSRRNQETYKKKNLTIDELHHWNCPKCTFTNSPTTSHCQNLISVVSERGKNMTIGRRKDASPTGQDNVVLCGFRKPRLFQPTLVTKHPNAVAAMSSNGQIHHKLYENKYQSELKQKKLERTKKLYAKKYSFKPIIGEVSRDIATATRKSTYAAKPEAQMFHHALYDEAKARKAKQEERIESHYSQFPFQPDIGPSRTLTKTDESLPEFINRLAIEDQRKKEDSIRRIHEEYESGRDPVTGQKLFAPNVGRGPLFNRNESNLPIGDFLYAARNEFRDLRRSRREEHEADEKRKREQGFVSKTSAALLDQRKARSYEIIFDKLQDSVIPEAGVAMELDVIDPKLVDLSVLKPETARVVKLLFEEVQWQKLERELFGEVFDHFVQQRKDITYSQIVFTKTPELPVCNKAEEEELEEKELTFHPEINENSRKLTQKRDPKDIYTTLNQQYQFIQKRKQRLKQSFDEIDYKECTFHPKLIANNKKYHDMYYTLGYLGGSETEQYSAEAPAFTTSTTPTKSTTQD